MMVNTNLVCLASFKENENLLKECIDMKYDLNEVTIFNGSSPLMLALDEHDFGGVNLDMVKLFVNNGADLNHVNYNGNNIHNITCDQDCLQFFQTIGVEKLENTKKGMSKLAVDMLNKKPCPSSTKEAMNQIDERGFTPLLWAIYHDYPDYIEYYMERGADINKPGKSGITPLMMAVLQLNVKLVKQLVKWGANINQLDNNGFSALCYFYDEEFFEIFDYLFDKGAEIDPCPSGKGKSPLAMAAIQNDDECFDYFLKKGANVNFIDRDGNSVLSYVILYEKTESAEKLIARDADVNACGPRGKPPLIWSVFANERKVTQFLIDNGAKVNQTDAQGRTALYYAEKYEYTEIAQLLKANGATFRTAAPNQAIFLAIQAKDIDSINQCVDNLNVYGKNEQNQTVIDAAVQTADFDIINLFLEKEKDLFVHTALPAAIQNKNIPLVKLLLEKGANVNRIYRKTKQSPLMQAINQQNEEIVALLLKFNANVRSNEDPSPFQRACQLSNGNIVKMLTEKVDVNQVENDKSFLEMAVDEHNTDVIMYLLKKGADPKDVVCRIKELAEECDELDIFLENVLLNFDKPEPKKQKLNN